MKVAITSAWLVEEQNEVTLTLTRADGQFVCGVVKLDRATELMKPDTNNQTFQESGWALRRKSDGAWWTHSGKGPRRMRLWADKPTMPHDAWDAVQVTISGSVQVL